MNDDEPDDGRLKYRVCFMLDEAGFRLLNNCAYGQRTTRSAVVRLALDELLTDDKPRRPKAPIPRQTA